MTSGSVDRPLTPAALRVLDVASDLFYRRGITTVGMELIAEQAGVTKKTIYDRFGSKESLVVAYLRARDQRWRDWLVARIAMAGGPVAGILATFDAIGEWIALEGQRGCAMINAYAELSDPDHPGRAVAVAQKEWLRARYRDLVAGTTASDPDTVAGALLILHEGALVAYHVGGLRDAPDIARRTAQVLLSGHLP